MHDYLFEHQALALILKGRRAAMLVLDPSFLVQHSVLGLIRYII